jgi:transcriptional regulator with XRE-family HTH domain
MEALGDRLKRLRVAAGMNLSQAEQASGHSRTTLRAAEEGKKRPSDRILARLSEVYGDPTLLSYTRLPKRPKGRTVYGKAGELIRSAFKFAKPALLVPSLEVAYKAATGYAAGRKLLHSIMAKRSQPPARWRGMKLLAHELTGMEQLAVLHLLDGEAEIESISPHNLGFAAPIMTQPHRPFLALVVAVDDVVLAFFPQLGVEHRRGSCPYLDFLVAMACDGHRLFVDLELDHVGHDQERDRLRQQALQLTTLRYMKRDIEQPDFGRRLIRDCVDLFHANTHHVNAA